MGGGARKVAPDPTSTNRCRTLGAVSDDTFDFAGRDITFAPGDSALLALTRHGIHPAGGGPLCFAGDCPNCLCTVDGISYVRACQTPAEVGVRIEPHPTNGEPPLPAWDTEAKTVAAIHRRADVVVIGGGESGQAARQQAADAGRIVELLDTNDGAEAIAVYPGPIVVARTADGMVNIECDDIVVATGAAEIQPIVPGSRLAGLWTPRAAAHVQAAGIDLGLTVAVGDVSDDAAATVVAPGELVRFEGEERLAAVITMVDGAEVRTEADNAIVGLGIHPRTGLARMANFMDVEVVGDAALEPTVPTCPSSGIACPCSNVTVEQLDDIYERGFTHMELLKRGTLAGTGTCQGSVCTPYLRSFLQDRGQELQPAFTFRPMAKQLTMNEIAAGSHLPALARTSLDSVHRDLGAQMDRMGGWWRPWTYGDTDAEYAAVRERVSLGDVSTLGKMILTGPDAEASLQRLFPTDVSTIKPGRSRYVLMLNERGYVMDDGMIAREHDGTFFLTFTSGGASMAEMWIRDWSASWGHDIRILNQTMSLGAINVTGPLAKELLERATDDDLPPFLGHCNITVAGVPCKVLRVSFTGELSFELHHPVDRSVELWTALMDLGADLGIQPHAIEALFRLRLEKGHIIVGIDTDYDSTPRRLQHEWAVNMKKGDFIGRTAIERTNRLALDKRLVGFRTEGRAPFEGAVVWSGSDYAGWVTSAAFSPTIGAGVALGWLEAVDGEFPASVTIDGLDAEIVSPHFYDPEGARPRA